MMNTESWSGPPSRPSSFYVAVYGPNPVVKSDTKFVTSKALVGYGSKRLSGRGVLTTFTVPVTKPTPFDSTNPSAGVKSSVEPVRQPVKKRPASKAKSPKAKKPKPKPSKFPLLLG